MPSPIDGMRFSSSGEDRVSPADPNRLSGSHSVSAFGATETLKWNLRRCGGALRLVDLKFEDMRFPVWEDWQEISEQIGTIDGNLVRIKAKRKIPRSSSATPTRETNGTGQGLTDCSAKSR